MTTASAFGAGPPVGICGETALTLAEGSTFWVSASSGDVLPDRAQGLFVADTRVVSMWQLRVDGVLAGPPA